MPPPFSYRGTLKLTTSETVDSYLDYLQHKLDKAGVIHLVREDGSLRFRDTRVNLIFAFLEPLSGITSAKISATKQNGGLLVKYEIYSWLVGTLSLLFLSVSLVAFYVTQTTDIFRGLAISLLVATIPCLAFFLPSYLYFKRVLQEERSRAG